MSKNHIQMYIVSLFIKEIDGGGTIYTGTGSECVNKCLPEV